MNNSTTSVTLLALALLPALVAAADEPPALSHNPFSRPDSGVTLSPGRVIDSNDSGEGTLDLQATMVGNARKLANVGGRILRIGDDIGGYMLVAVFERYAIFERDGRTTTVYVKPLVAENDD